MNTKVIAGLAIIAIILSSVSIILFLFFCSDSPLLNAPQEISPIKVRNISMRNATDYYEVRVETSTTIKPLTLYNCYMKIDYLTQSNTWKTVSGYVGTVDFRAYAIEDEVVLRSTVSFDMDFSNDCTNMRMFTNMVSTYTGSNVEIEAYGYPKP